MAPDCNGNSLRLGPTSLQLPAIVRMVIWHRFTLSMAAIRSSKAPVPMVCFFGVSDSGSVQPYRAVLESDSIANARTLWLRGRGTSVSGLRNSLYVISCEDQNRAFQTGHVQSVRRVSYESDIENCPIWCVRFRYREQRRKHIGRKPCSIDTRPLKG